MPLDPTCRQHHFAFRSGSGCSGRSILALMVRKDEPALAHPAFWAPFIVVGEGNERWEPARGPVATQ